MVYECFLSLIGIVIIYWILVYTQYILALNYYSVKEEPKASGKMSFWVKDLPYYCHQAANSHSAIM